MKDEEYRREELIREIEHRVEQMSLRQLEALQYELETKDYSGSLLCYYAFKNNLSNICQTYENTEYHYVFCYFFCIDYRSK